MPFLLTDLQTAELVKVSANAFLATKISFINAISEVCEAADADVTLLADALGYDAGIGRRFLNAGLGFGGGCLPKDIRAFMARAGELGANHALTFLREVDSINMRRRTRMVELATKACGGSLLGANVAVLGAAFKPESDDVRDSPALNVAGMLQLNGATVNVYDPKAMENSQRLFPTLNYSTSAVEACDRADAVLVLTEWREFVELEPDELAAVVRQRHCRRPQLPGFGEVAGGGLGISRRRSSVITPLMEGEQVKRHVLILVENESVPLDRRVWQESQALVEAGYDVTVICPIGAERDRERDVMIEGVRILRFPLRMADGGLFSYLREYTVALIHMLRLAITVRLERRIDVVQACNPPDMLFLIALVLRLGGLDTSSTTTIWCPSCSRRASRAGSGSSVG